MILQSNAILLFPIAKFFKIPDVMKGLSICQLRVACCQFRGDFFTSPLVREYNKLLKLG